MPHKTSKWGTLATEDKVFAGTKRKQRPRVPYQSSYFYSESDTPQYTLEEYKEFLKTVRVSNNNNDKDDVNLTNAALVGLKKVYLKTSGKDATYSSKLWETAVKAKDMKMLQDLSDFNFGDKLYIAHDEFGKIARLVLDTHNPKIMDFVFYTHAFTYYGGKYMTSNLDIFSVNEYLFDLYIKGPRKIFEDCVLYFLDIIISDSVPQTLQKTCDNMRNTNDLALLETLLGHENFLKSVGSTYGENLITDIITKSHDAGAEMLERILKENPKIAKNKIYIRTGDFITQPILMLAAKHKCPKLVQLLLEYGADPNAKSSDNKTIMHFVDDNSEIKRIIENSKDYNKISEVKGFVSQNALKRIMKDWQEVINEPLSDSVRAFPNESNMFEWHVVLTPPSNGHPLAGLNFHFVMIFPKNYPESPPSIKGSQYLPHPNYFGGYLCLNMLRPFMPEYAQYSGWSSGYSAQSILMQLQSFLFDKDVDQDYGYTHENEISNSNIDRAHIDCIKYSCKKCGFNQKWKGYEGKYTAKYLGEEFTERLKKIANLPYLEDPEYGYVEDPAKWPNKRNSNFVSQASLLTLPDDMIVQIFDCIPRFEDLYPALKVCRRLRQVGEQHGLFTRRELVCYYSKETFLQDVIGVGLAVERNASGKIKSLSSPMELMSKTAFFRDFQRLSSWQEPFQYWLPLIIDPKHSQKALPYLQATIVAILHGVSFDIDEITRSKRAEDIQIVDNEKSEEKLMMLARNFQPLMVLDVLPKLMNNTVVAMMREDEDATVTLHHSEKALLGYCSYHHILLELCKRYPEIQRKIDFVLEQFIRHESARVKLAQPDLGELLVYLSVSSKITWRQIAPAFLQEMLSRNVVWMLDQETGKGRGELAYLETDEVSDYRLNVSFASSRTGMRLLMFQVFFLEKVGRPAGSSLNKILQRLHASYGRPPLGVPVMLQKECENIYKVQSWPQFFAKIGLPCPSKQQMTEKLRQAIRDSEHKGYHVNRVPEEQLFKWRINRDQLFASKNTTYTPKPTEPENTTKENTTKENTTKENTTKENTTKENKTSNGHSISEKSSSNAPVKIYVGNLSFRVTALDLEFVFKQFGKLVSSEIKYDDNGKSRGFGFIEVENENVANSLLQFMQGSDVDRRPVKLERVTGKPSDRPFKPRPYVPKPVQPVIQEKLTQKKEQPVQRKDKTTQKKDKSTQPKIAKQSNPFANLSDE